MRSGQRHLLAVCITAALSFTITTAAQIDNCGVGPGQSGIGIGGQKRDAPFTGTVKTSFDRKLADGNEERKVSSTHPSRDSAGRERSEFAVGCARSEDGQTHEQLIVIVNDSVAHTTMSWQVGADQQPKIVSVFHQLDSAPSVKSTKPSAAELERQQKELRDTQVGQVLLRSETKTESLGVKQIAGFSAQGTRTTRTIPAGQEGNDQPLAVVTETWESKELGITLMSISDDPRRGRITSVYEELNLGEPDPGLFVPPPGYTLQDQPQKQVASWAAMSSVSK
jgi:hypothetical protein